MYTPSPGAGFSLLVREKSHESRSRDFAWTALIYFVSVYGKPSVPVTGPSPGDLSELSVKQAHAEYLSVVRLSIRKHSRTHLHYLERMGFPGLNDARETRIGSLGLTMAHGVL